MARAPECPQPGTAQGADDWTVGTGQQLWPAVTDGTHTSDMLWVLRLTWPPFLSGGEPPSP